jgi:hypothetical protein
MGLTLLAMLKGATLPLKGARWPEAIALYF